MDRPKRLVEPCIYEILGTTPQAYWVAVGATNNERRLTKTVIGIRKARDTRAAFRALLKSGSLKSRTIFKHITSVLAYYLRNKYRKSSQWQIGSGRKKLHFWRDRIGEVDPKALTKEDLNEVIHEMQAEGYENSGIRPYISTLKAALNFCNEEGRIKIDMRELETLADMTVKRVPKLSIAREDVDAILAKMPEWTRAFIMYKILVPCRVLELHEARTATINISKRIFTLSADTTKTDQERDMPIPEILLPYFQQALDSGREFIFMRPEVQENGEVMWHKLARNFISKAFSEARDGLELDSRIKLRLLRHEAVRAWKRAVGDDKLVATVAGASVETINRHYDTVEIPSIIRASAMIEKAEADRFKGFNVLEFKKAEAV